MVGKGFGRSCFAQPTQAVQTHMLALLQVLPKLNQQPLPPDKAFTDQPRVLAPQKIGLGVEAIQRVDIVLLGFGQRSNDLILIQHGGKPLTGNVGLRGVGPAVLHVLPKLQPSVVHGFAQRVAIGQPLVEFLCE